MNHIPIVMPQMGQSVAEGTIVAWKKQPGEPIAADEVLLEVETDKTTVAVESPAAGRLLACRKQAGEVAAAGEVIGTIETEAASAGPGAHTPHAGGRDAEARLVAAPAVEARSLALPEINNDRLSPYVMRLALQNDISQRELETLHGSGAGGRITKNDVLQHLARRPAATEPPARPARAEAPLGSLQGRIVPMTTIRRTIADHMVQSIHTSAHVTMVHAVDVSHVVRLRNRLKDDFAARHGAKLTYTGVLLYVTSRVLPQFPIVNASVAGTNLVLHDEINIGCAVATTDESLVVPVVRHADRKSFVQVSCELDELISLARTKSLTREHIEGGTFTLSNFGAFGSLIGTPIISQPQVAILGMGAVFQAPVVVDGQIVVRDQLYLSFSFDHRVIDGALGGRFLNALQKATEALSEADLT